MIAKLVDHKGKCQHKIGVRSNFKIVFMYTYYDYLQIVKYLNSTIIHNYLLVH